MYERDYLVECLYQIGRFEHITKVDRMGKRWNQKLSWTAFLEGLKWTLQITEKYFSIPYNASLRFEPELAEFEKNRDHFALIS